MQLNPNALGFNQAVSLTHPCTRIESLLYTQLHGSSGRHLVIFQELASYLLMITNKIYVHPLQLYNHDLTIQLKSAVLTIDHSLLNGV